MLQTVGKGVGNIAETIEECILSSIRGVVPPIKPRTGVIHLDDVRQSDEDVCGEVEVYGAASLVVRNKLDESELAPLLKAADSDVAIIVNVDVTNGEGSSERNFRRKMAVDTDEAYDFGVLVGVDGFGGLQVVGKEGRHRLPEQGHGMGGGRICVKRWTVGFLTEWVGRKIVFVFICDKRCILET